jgi:hypothetical protein
LYSSSFVNQSKQLKERGMSRACSIHRQNKKFIKILKGQTNLSIESRWKIDIKLNAK